MTFTMDWAGWFLLAGVLIGIAGGMLGIGGGILVIPILVAIFKFGHVKAVGTSLAMLLPPIGIFAFIEYYRHGNVDVRAAIFLALGFSIGAFLGSKAVNQQLVSTETLRLLFAFFLLYVAGSIIFRQTSSTVWATVKTGLMMGFFAVGYVLALLIGKRLARRFSAREAFVSNLSKPVAPDYEI